MKSLTVFCIQCGAANPSQARFCFSCGQDVSEKNGLAGKRNRTVLLKPGTVLKERYGVLGQIGQGGFGAVYKAEDKELGQRLLAIKEMGQHNSSSQDIQEGVEAFKREALMLAGVKHEHLPRIYDHFSENDRWYLVMDYIEGETLEARLDKSRQGGLPLVMALKIAVQLCSVLDYLHTRQPPIIFRDLKPANVILTPEGGLCLIDFGIARHFKPGQARDTMAFGSPGYAAPEQYGKAQTTPRADIYSLGAITHQMLSGIDPSLSPFRFVPLLTQDHMLQKLVVSMLEMDEVKRPAKISDVKAVLQLALEQPARQMSGPVRAFQASPPANYPPVAASGSLLTPILVHEHHYGRVRAVGWSPDSQYAASATDAIIRVWEAQKGRNISSYRDHVGPIKHMVWSSSRMRIASISEENKIRIWDANTGKVISIYVTDPGIGRGFTNALSWSRDGRYLAAVGRGYIHIWDTDRSELTASVKHRLHDYTCVSWSSDGLTLAAGYGSKVAIWQLMTGKRVGLYHYRAPVNIVAWSPNGRYLASGGYDQTIQVWDISRQSLVVTYHNHIQPICAISWSPDSQRIASSSFASQVNVWDVLTGQEIISYQAHAGMTLAVSWSPDGNSILSGGSDRRVCIWRAP